MNRRLQQRQQRRTPRRLTSATSTVVEAAEANTPKTPAPKMTPAKVPIRVRALIRAKSSGFLAAFKPDPWSHDPLKEAQ